MGKTKAEIEELKMANAGRIKNICLNMALFLSSVIIALALAEIFARSLLKVEPFSQMKLRYTIDGTPSFAPGFYSRSEDYPISNKPNLDYWYSERYSYPIETRIQTNEKGFRLIPQDNRRTNTLLVGDSLIFGYGAAAKDTVAFNLQNIAALGGVHSLGVSGWGPASYIKSSTLALSELQFENIIIFYTLANDDHNLFNSCWPELERSEIPQGRILRNDIPQYSVYTPPNFLLTTPLRNLALSKLLFDSLQLSKIHGISKTPPAAGSQVERVDIVEKTIRAHEDLKKGYCVTPDHKSQINNIIFLLNEKKSQDAEVKSLELSVDLAKKSCAPLISSDNFAFDKVKRKMNYAFVARRQFLHMSDGSHPEARDASHCQSTPENNIKKRAIFLNWLEKLTKNHYVHIFLVPPEFNIGGHADEHWLCNQERASFECDNLTKFFSEHYGNNDNALFLDGVHLNGTGAKFVAKKIESLLQLQFNIERVANQK